jgi:hypothetical protein
MLLGRDQANKEMKIPGQKLWWNYRWKQFEVMNLIVKVPYQFLKVRLGPESSDQI